MQEQQTDTLSKYGQSFQSKVLSALLVDGKFLDTISEITTSKFFENDANKWIISEIVSKNLPSTKREDTTFDWKDCPYFDNVSVCFSCIDSF